MAVPPMPMWRAEYSIGVSYPPARAAAGSSAGTAAKSRILPASRMGIDRDQSVAESLEAATSAAALVSAAASAVADASTAPPSPVADASTAPPSPMAVPPSPGLGAPGRPLQVKKVGRQPWSIWHWVHPCEPGSLMQAERQFFCAQVTTAP